MVLTLTSEPFGGRETEHAHHLSSRWFECEIWFRLTTSCKHQNPKFGPGLAFTSFQRRGIEKILKNPAYGFGEDTYIITNHYRVGWRVFLISDFECAAGSRLELNKSLWALVSKFESVRLQPGCVSPASSEEEHGDKTRKTEKLQGDFRIYQATM